MKLLILLLKLLILLFITYCFELLIPFVIVLQTVCYFLARSFAKLLFPQTCKKNFLATFSDHCTFNAAILAASARTNNH